MSTTSTSSSPHSTSRSICSSALITIGPRQIIGVSSSRGSRSTSPSAVGFSIGFSILPSARSGRPVRPEHARHRGAVDVGVEHADLEAVGGRPSARLTAVVDLPTPPLPDATAMMCLTPGTSIHHAERGDAATRHWIDHGIENLADGRFADFRHVLLLPLRRNFACAA
jgi:hypothetical protein